MNDLCYDVQITARALKLRFVNFSVFYISSSTALRLRPLACAVHVHEILDHQCKPNIEGVYKIIKHYIHLYIELRHHFKILQWILINKYKKLLSVLRLGLEAHGKHQSILEFIYNLESKFKFKFVSSII